jgi:DNA excision repair protein ERCC-3
VDAWARGHIKQELLKIGWPAEDHAGYTPGTPHEIDLPRTAGRCARTSARPSTSSARAARASSCSLRRRQDARRRRRDGRHEDDDAHPRHQHRQRAAVARRAAQAHVADPRGDRRVLGQVKEVKPVTIATYQILTAKRKGQYAHLALLDALDWGLIVYDEVHLLPAPVFKLTADLQARRRLGLTATLVREDGREGDVFSLIGPKRFDAPWKEIEAQGFISPPSATRCASTSRRPTAWSTRPPPTTSATVSPPRRTRRSAS